MTDDLICDSIRVKGNAIVGPLKEGRCGRLSVRGDESERSTKQDTMISIGTQEGPTAEVYRRFNGKETYLGIQSYSLGNKEKTPIILQEYGGKVGIGTTEPERALHLLNNDGQCLVLQSSKGSEGSTVSLDFQTYLKLNNPLNPTASLRAIDDGKFSSHLTFFTKEPGQDPNVLEERLRITSDGKVGIRTTTPSAELEVKGSIVVSGDLILANADCAEDFDIVDVDSIEPGTVMVIDNEGALRASEQAYDKRVAGVISGAGDLRPGIMLDRHAERTNRLPIALTGKVYCKVDAEYNPIDVGDLLTTSPTIGHAMKVGNYTESIGAIIGKAMRPLKSGRGIIPILVALQ